jgi:hypothetical protein
MRLALKKHLKIKQNVMIVIKIALIALKILTIARLVFKIWFYMALK